MITASDLFVQKLSEPNRQFYAQLVDSKGIVITGSIRSITVSKGACGEDTFSVGSVYSSYIELIMDDCSDVLENEELLLQIGIVMDEETGEADYIDIGYYTVTKPKRTVYQMSFTAVGRIVSKLNCVPKALPQEKKLEDIADIITETTGVPIICKGVALEGALDIDLTGLTCISLLKIITDVVGGFATEDNSGGIVISKFATNNPIKYDSDDTTTIPEFNDYDYELSGVEVIVVEDTTDEEGNVQKGVSYSAGTPRLTMAMPYMTEELFSAFAENIVGYKYRPGTVHLSLGDPRLEPWDCIEFTDVKGNVFIVPCLNITHTFDGGISTTITAPGSSTAEEDAQVKGPITIQLENIRKEASDAINNLQIGSRNLIRNSESLLFEDYYFGELEGVYLVHQGDSTVTVVGADTEMSETGILTLNDASLDDDGSGVVTVTDQNDDETGPGIKEMSFLRSEDGELFEVTDKAAREEIEDLKKVTAAWGDFPIASSSAVGGIKSGGDVTVSSDGVVTVNDDSHNHVIDNVDGLQDALNAKAPLASPALTGTPTAPTAAAGTNNTQLATTAFVNTAIANGIAASDAMIFKGTIGTGGTVTALPTTYKTGWTYRVITAGTYAGVKCEVGDLIVALVDRSGSGNVNADWTVAQTNIDGAITSITGTASIEVTGSGSSRTITHKTSGVTSGSYGDSSDKRPSFGGSFKVPYIIVDETGHIKSISTHDVVMPVAAASTSANGLMTKEMVVNLNDLKDKVVTNPIVPRADNIILPAGDTSVQWDKYPAEMYSYFAYDATTGDEVYLDVCREPTMGGAVDFTISAPHENAIAIRILYLA